SVERPTRVALALGSGGARGYAHIGAIQVIEERGLQIVSIAGASMGALVGGLHAAGSLRGYTEWVIGLKQRDILRMLDLSISAPGALRAERIFARVRELIGDVRIEDLPVHFTAVATDLFARREVWFQHGPLELAIRASAAIPGILAPVMHNGRVLVDGGLLDPIPIAPTRGVNTDTTIAIDLAGDRTSRSAPLRETADRHPIEEMSDRLRRSASRLMDRDLARQLMGRLGRADGRSEPELTIEALAGAPEAELESLPANLGKFDVVDLSFEAMISVLTRYRLAGYPPDVVVHIPKDACRTLDFHRATEVIELGRTLTAEALDRAGLTGTTPNSSVTPSIE
ncbi:MAG: patatin-like phospholipase family protein, partial [Ilumatobacteraceae bacterium]